MALVKTCILITLQKSLKARDSSQGTHAAATKEHMKLPSTTEQKSTLTTGPIQDNRFVGLG